MEDTVKEACIRDLKAYVGDAIRMARLRRRISHTIVAHSTQCGKIMLGIWRKRGVGCRGVGK